MVAGQPYKMFFIKKFFNKIYYKKYSKKSYSISNVDLVLERLFKDINQGVYIDVGCNHPIKYNNTYLLHKKGWCGINVDADNSSIKLFNIFRKKDYNVNCVLSDKEEIKDFYFYHERSAINTLSKELVNSRKTKPAKTIKIKSKTLNQILENSPFNLNKINLLSIDIENHEYEVLKNFNFSKYKIDVIVTECIDLSLKKLEIYNQSLNFVMNSNIYKLLVSNNYKLINWVHSDLVFVRNDF
jgi:FkbM family methyltransferase